MTEYAKYRKELFSRQLTEKELDEIMDYVNKKDVYRTQKLSPRYICEYILNPIYDWCVEDSYIFLSDIMPYQDHLTIADISNYIKEKNKNDKVDLEDISNLDGNCDSYVTTHSSKCIFVEKILTKLR